jgi:hypothetical protein
VAAGTIIGDVVGEQNIGLERRVAAGQPVRLGARPGPLAGRESLLTDLDACLTPEKGADSPPLVVLSGLGGVGKTSVAVEYAYRHLAGLGVVWQFAAEEPTALAAGFSDLAAALGAIDLLTVGDPVAAVHGVLAVRPGGWLLIFDNVTGPAAIQGVLPPTGDGRVVITSRSALWPGQVLEIPVLDVSTAAGFLASRTGRAAEETAARELATELGGLPLALEQAAAYMQATGRSIAEYLQMFRQRRLDLLARGEATGYGRQVTTTWALAFDQIQQDAAGAAGLLRLLACCAPDAVPLGLLLQPRPGLAGSFGAEVEPLLEPLLADPLALDDAVTVLRRYSLISAPQDGAVSVHRLVQAVTLAQLPEATAGEWRQAAAMLIEAALPADSQQLPATWPVFAVLAPHARAAMPAQSSALVRIADYLGYSGNYDAARDLSQQVLEVQERVHGPEDPRTLNTRDFLARWTGWAGDPAGARDQFAALLPVDERVRGAEHPDTLVTRLSLAQWTGQAGDPAGARDQFAALLPIYERVLGMEYPSTLATRLCLAHFTGEAGDPAGARDQFAALLPSYERVLGVEHPDTLAARASLAYFTGQAGDAARARDQFAALLPIRERVLGVEHPDTLGTRANLAYLTGEAGDAVVARDQYAALLPILERVLGAEHPDTLATRANLAYWSGQAG